MKTNNDIIDAMHQVSKNTSKCNKLGQERNQVCKTMNQHNDLQQEKMVQVFRKRMINNGLDAMHQRCLNTNQHNKLWQERNKQFEIASQDNKRQQDQIGPLIWHAST